MEAGCVRGGEGGKVSQMRTLRWQDLTDEVLKEVKMARSHR